MAFSASYKQVDVLVDILDKQLIFQLIYPIEYVGISDRIIGGSMNMLLPAMLCKESLLNGLKTYIYDDEMLFYSGWNGFTLPEISDEFDGYNYRYAIIDGDNVIGYFCYHYDTHSRCLSNFGLYSFDRGNPIIGKDILREIRRIIKEFKPHRMEWRMIGGNPVEKHYDKFCKR